MDGPTRHLGAAAIACGRCRRFKMRCIGAESPPCQRCQKANKECVVREHSKRKRLDKRDLAVSRMRETNTDQEVTLGNDIAAPSGDSHGSSVTCFFDAHLSNPGRLRDPETMFIPLFSPSNPSPSELSSTASNGDITASVPLPSVYSTSPIKALGVPSALSSACICRHPAAASNLDVEALVEIPVDVLPEKEISQLILFFEQKLLGYVPILTRDDIVDIPNLLGSHSPLAYAIAYIAARFVPGYGSIRMILLPHILSIVRCQVRPASRFDASCWTLVQALGVLYAYASPDLLNDQNGHATSVDELNLWRLKSSAEELALRLELHQSFEDVEAALESKTPNLSKTLSFRQYFYWLWLFTMSHHVSLLTRTPPTIREDATARYAAELLGNMKDEPEIQRLLAEVELCLLWGQASLHQRDLVEWWCPSPRTLNLTSALSVLHDLDAALGIWSQRWCVSNAVASGSGAAGLKETSIDFHYRFTRFCISTYAIRCLNFWIQQNSHSAKIATHHPLEMNELLDLFKNAVRYAGSCIQFILELSPLKLESIRFMSSSGFAMIAFPCWFVMEASSSPIYKNAVPHTYLDYIERVALLMQDLTPDPTHAAKVYGERVMSKLGALRAAAVGP